MVFCKQGLIGHVPIKIAKKTLILIQLTFLWINWAIICLVLTWGNGTILKISILKWLKLVKSPNFGVFGDQNQTKVDSNPELYESSLETKEIIW